MNWSRREFLAASSGALLTASTPILSAQEAQRDEVAPGAIDGHPVARRVGLQILADGGNAIDAAVAAALATAVASPYQCGIGGYGGHMTIAPAGGEVTVIDFNTEAPAATRPDLFAPRPDGTVAGDVNQYGWLASGVPGTMAGLQMVVDRFGSKSLDELLQPAIGFAEQGFLVEKWFATVIRRAAPHLSQDPASARLYVPDGKPLAEGARLRNAQTAELLRTLAKRGSVDSFYRGDIAQQIAAAFKAGGGLVTADDLAAYRAREIKPLRFDWRGHTLCTAPLPAGGTTVFETLSLLNALGETANLTTPAGIHAWVETMRVSWRDRLTLFGDPAFVDVPLDRLLSENYARQVARRITQAVKSKKPLSLESPQREQDGTIHISAADRAGNLIALTLTHGAAFGAHVTVGELGILLGAGMSRFDPHPEHRNAPAAGKRPLHNMCPTIALKDGRPVLAVGGAGGRRIPNAVAEVLWHFLGGKMPVAQAVTAPRVHSEGGMDVAFDGPVIETAKPYLEQIGYTVGRRKIALASAASHDAKEGRTAAASG